MWVQAESDARLEPEVGLTESELSHAEWTVISLPGSSSCPVFFFFCPITCVYVNDVAPRTAKSPRQGETEVAKKTTYSEIRIADSLEALQLQWLHFIKVKIFAGQKG